MALNFPDNPTIGDIYTDDTSGFSYEWNGTVWISYTAAASKNISILDNISGSFNGSTDTFSITVSSTPFVPANAQQLRIVLGGVIQEPGVDYTVSGSNIIFTTPPAGALSFSGVSLGPAVSVSVPGDSTVTPSKLSAGGPSWNADGDVYISGITTITNTSGTVTVGVGTTALLVEGNARVTGILTVGTSSITLDGSSNEIKIGAGITISSTGITGSASTVTSASVAYALEGSPNLNVGVVTASSFVGDVTGSATSATSATTATTATNVTVTANNSTNETVYPVFVDGATGSQGAETDTNLYYNPATNTLTAGTFSGALSGNSTTASTLQTSRTINGISFDGSANIVTNPSSGAYSNGYGTRTVQSGGSASGGSSGDIYYIY